LPIPNLKEVVLESLNFFSTQGVQPIDLQLPSKTIVVASGNALPTGRVLFGERNFVFRNEGTYQHFLDLNSNYEVAVVLSASGEKHAPDILQDLTNRGIEAYLVTSDGGSTAASILPRNHVFESPSIAEPLTYNTSTYLGMMLAKTGESANDILTHIQTNVAPLIADIGQYKAFYFLISTRFESLAEMFVTKFDELFGGRVIGRCYTMSQTMHAKTIVPWDEELFISLGENNNRFGTQRLHLPLAANSDFAAMLAIGYYVIGQIQAQKPPWFADNIQSYAAIQSKLFHL
jgi:hypothetical protein